MARRDRPGETPAGAQTQTAGQAGQVRPRERGHHEQIDDRRYERTGRPSPPGRYPQNGKAGGSAQGKTQVGQKLTPFRPGARPTSGDMGTSKSKRFIATTMSRSLSAKTFLKRIADRNRDKWAPAKVGARKGSRKMSKLNESAAWYGASLFLAFSLRMHAKTAGIDLVSVAYFLGIVITAWISLSQK